MAAEDDNAGPKLLVIAIVMVTLCLVRYSRNFLGPDDYIIAAATLVAVGRVIIQCVSVQYGNGRHRQFLSKADYTHVNFLTWLTQLFLFPLLCLLKLSVCLLVLRIKNTKPLRYFLWTVMAGLVVTTLLPDIVLLAECTPVSAYWKSQREKCWDPRVRIYSIYLQTAMSVLTDIIYIEFGTGILGANLALSRTYLDYFRKGVRNLTHRSKSRDAEAGQVYQLGNRGVYDGQMSAQCRRDVEARRGSYARSDESKAPLDPSIIRRVEIHISRTDRSRSGGS
ncbi:hypothetical protein LTR65_009375 [Meristemomyces frigidus]